MRSSIDGRRHAHETFCGAVTDARRRRPHGRRAHARHARRLGGRACERRLRERGRRLDAAVRRQRRRQRGDGGGGRASVVQLRRAERLVRDHARGGRRLPRRHGRKRLLRHRPAPLPAGRRRPRRPELHRLLGLLQPRAVQPRGRPDVLPAGRQDLGRKRHAAGERPGGARARERRLRGRDSDPGHPVLGRRRHDGGDDGGR